MIKKIVLIFLLANPALSGADIYKFTDPGGRVYYIDAPDRHALYRLLIKTKTTKELQAIRKEEARQARQDYRDRVNATARFLDDVESARKHHK